MLKRLTFFTCLVVIHIVPHNASGNSRRIHIVLDIDGIILDKKDAYRYDHYSILESDKYLVTYLVPGISELLQYLKDMKFPVSLFTSRKSHDVHLLKKVHLLDGQPLWDLIKNPFMHRFSLRLWGYHSYRVYTAKHLKRASHETIENDNNTSLRKNLDVLPGIHLDYALLIDDSLRYMAGNQERNFLLPPLGYHKHHLLVTLGLLIKAKEVSETSTNKLLVDVVHELQQYNGPPSKREPLYIENKSLMDSYAKIALAYLGNTEGPHYKLTNGEFYPCK